MSKHRKGDCNCDPQLPKGYHWPPDTEGNPLQTEACKARANIDEKTRKKRQAMADQKFQTMARIHRKLKDL